MVNITSNNNMLFRGKLPCSKLDVQLAGTLDGGQSFRWHQTPNSTWIGVFSGRVWFLQQDDDFINYQVHDPIETIENNQTIVKYNEILSNYFRLNVNLRKYYDEWTVKDMHFKMAARAFYGIRLLDQDIVENLFAFICSQNNHISRISSLVEKLARFYGEKITTIDGVDYYAFPSLEALTKKGLEADLRKHGFGYRSKYITDCACAIQQNGGVDYLTRMRTIPYEEARTMLISLPGIGPKLADCICLMSLGHLEAVPVDVHVFRIATNHYLPELKKRKTLTPPIYAQIRQFFHELFGPLAGWAHLVLFCADLKKPNAHEDTRTSKRIKT